MPPGSQLPVDRPVFFPLRRVGEGARVSLWSLMAVNWRFETIGGIGFMWVKRD